MKKLALIVFVLGLPAAAEAQPVTGNLRAENALRELTGNPSTAANLTVTVPSGVARSLLAITTDSTNVLNVLPQTSSSTDYTAVINTALALGKPVLLPYTGTTYQISNVLTFPAGANLTCAQGVIIHISAAASVGWQIATSGSGASINGCFFQGDNLHVDLANITQDHFTWTGGGGNQTGTIFVSGSSAIDDTIQNIKMTNGYTIGIDLASNAVHTSVIHSEFESMGGFGIRVDSGANKFYLSGNWTYANAIELIGVTKDGWGGVIIGNHAEGTGDNGISVTGYDNVVANNVGYRVAFDPLYIYGSYNTVTGNKATDGGQSHNPAFPFYNAGDTRNYAGIVVSGNFGGSGQDNVLAGNIEGDDQAVQTQAYGFEYGPGYNPWAASTVYTPIGLGSTVYVYNAGNIYSSTVGGTSGTTAPTCTTGTCSDGGITWTFVATTPQGTREAANNSAYNHVNANSIEGFFDGTVNHSNAYYGDGLIETNPIGDGSGTANIIGTGFQNPIGKFWISGTTYGYSQSVFDPTGAHLYRFLGCASGGSCATGGSTVRPTHTTGTVTESDGDTWLFLQAGVSWPTLLLNQQTTVPGTLLSLPIEESKTTFCNTYAGTGTPLGKVVDHPCATYLASGGGAGTTLYVKESATDATGWVPADPIQSVAGLTGTISASGLATALAGTALYPLVGTSSSIGGSALAAGACATGTVAVTGSTTAQGVAVAPVTYPGDGTLWEGYVSTAGTVTIKVCSLAGNTPTASVYNVRVIQ